MKEMKEMTVGQMIAKGILLVCCAPIVLLLILPAIFGSLIYVIIHLIRNRSKSANDFIQEQPETASNLGVENYNLMPVNGWAMTK